MLQFEYDPTFFRLQRRSGFEAYDDAFDFLGQTKNRCAQRFCC